ncbi:MAG: phosphoribosylformylglycinamidine cyclo-ligase [Propionibacteriaceae bacterium]|jgi:phosphoribosylformylglycinamidine cyclo-ligase|nr:phosphoribosylformylglycinamidine cyclo-ligase [Propionibacteriaceae bacterium]
MAANESAYAAAGVDIEAGDRAVELMKAAVAKARRPEVLGSLGGFAGLFDAGALAKYRHPILATSTDGVGTKVAIAQALGKYDTIGYDLVGMLIDDLVVVGAEPLFLTDYIACGKVFPERIAAIVSGIAAACAENNVAVLGGETAEHPGLLEPDEFDIAGATTGVVEADELLGPERVQAGDVLLALESSGLHSNGYSLVRKVLLADANFKLSQHIDDLGKTLGEELLTPTKVYAADCLSVLAAAQIHAMSHITGGGLENNLLRVIPQHLKIQIDWTSWQPAPIFHLVQEVGKISFPDLAATLNLGVGMVMILPESSLATAQQVLRERGVKSWTLGAVTA